MVNFVALLVLATPLQVQQSVPTISFGQRVRIAGKDSATPLVVGTLTETDSNRLSVRVTEGGTTVSVPLGSVANVRVSRGIDTESGVKKGALLGVGVGAIIFASQYSQIKRDDAFGLDVPLSAIAYLGLVPAVFALGGGLLAGERWEPGSVAMQESGAAAPASIRFANSEPVRATTLSSGTLTGSALRSGQDSLILSNRGLAWPDVQSLEVRAGQNRARGALLGAAIGLGLSIAAQVSSPIPEAGAATGAFVLMIGGGAILGSKLLAGSQWVPLPVPR